MTFAQRLVTGDQHVIVLTETEAPRVFEVRCTACHTRDHYGLPCSARCHRVTWTPRGEEHAREIGELHVFYMDHPDSPRLHHVPAFGGAGGSGGRIR